MLNEPELQEQQQLLAKHFPPTEAAISAGEALSGLNDIPRLSHQEDTFNE